jgi:regulator of sigma E protease
MMQFLAIDWSVVGLKAAQLLLSLSILVILHEFGHYIAARIFKCRVEKFYLFFNPWFSLVKKKVGDTEYGIGWLPLGGYVKIAGMVDESMDKDQLKQPPQPHEFRSKPAWQRIIIMLGGIIVNVLLAIVIYSMILMVWGERDIKADSLKYGLSFNDPIFVELGFKNGDNVIAVDGEPVEKFSDVLKKILLVNKTVRVTRNGTETDIQMPKDLIGKLIEKRRKNTGVPLITPRVPVIVDQIADSMPAYKAGLRKGDYILSVNGKPAQFRDQFQQVMEPLKKGTSILMQVQRGADTIELTTSLYGDAMIGFGAVTDPKSLSDLRIYSYETKTYGFFEAFPAGFRKTGAELTFYIDQFKKILDPETGGYKGVGGFKAMGSVFSGTGWDWEHFWTITAFFSIVLAFMNLLPIPALDGGHVLFTLVEMITGRKPSDKFLEIAQVIGMIILLALMLYANGNDWFGWGK